MISKIDRNIIRLVSEDLPLVEKPFEVLAQKLGMGENELLRCIRHYKNKGLLRKYSAVVNHRKIGFRYNAMAVWDIPARSVVKAGKIISSFSHVSHCYQRKRASGWNYNLYSMIHGRVKDECLNLIKEISKKINCKNYRVLFSSKEYKKTGVKY